MLYLDIVDIIMFAIGICAGMIIWEVLHNGKE